MSGACNEFRARLVRALSGAPVGGDLTELSWHAHLLACDDCKALLEAEEALEVLLSTLPDPRLPERLARRVLARLADVREATDAERELDALLALDETAQAPEDLAGGVLAALRPHRREREQRALDRVLDQLPSPGVPAGMAERVLLALEPHRTRRRPQLVGWRSASLAAAVLVALGLGLWFAGSSSDEPRDIHVAASTPERGPEVVREPDPEVLPEDGPSDELLASLDLLESWEFLTNDELDLAIASLDAVDEVLFDLQAEGI